MNQRSLVCRALAVLTITGLIAPLWAADDPEIGIYFRPSREKEQAILGYEGIKLALEEHGYEEQVRYVANLQPETLKGLRLLILPSVHGYPKNWKEEDVRGNLRTFVESGGGALLLNESMGWRRALAKTPPFPEIGHGTGKGDAYMNSVAGGVGPMTAKFVPLEVVKKAHPVTQGITGEFKALHDMPDILPGEKGEVLVRKGEGDGAAVVAGAFGKGRVVLLAPALGVGPRNMEEAPGGAQLQLLLNAVQWATGKD